MSDSARTCPPTSEFRETIKIFVSNCPLCKGSGHPSLQSFLLLTSSVVWVKTIKEEKQSEVVFDVEEGAESKAVAEEKRKKEAEEE